MPLAAKMAVSGRFSCFHGPVNRPKHLFFVGTAAVCYFFEAFTWMLKKFIF